MSTSALNDAMPARPLAARWVFRGLLRLETATHFGGEGERVDMPLLRDERSGAPLLTGSSLAGALRGALCDRLAGYAKREPGGVAALFGAARAAQDGEQSPLIVFDAIGALPQGGLVEIRDGVAIDAASGVAEEHKKFDFEVLPRGTEFPVRLDLLVGDGRKEAELLTHLADAADALAESALGARRSRGLGRMTLCWAARRFDLTSAAGWRAWAGSDHQDPCATPPGHARLRDAVLAEAPHIEFAAAEDQRNRILIELELEPVHDLLVRSPAAGSKAPDVTHLHSGGQPILPGTSLAGVMRAQALRIAKLLRGDADGKAMVAEIFGPRLQGTGPHNKTLPASRIRVGEAPLDGAEPRRQIRIAVDRFTGAAADTALFDEEPVEGGHARIRIELRTPRPGELGLVLLVLKDLLEGCVGVGGTTSVGRGEMRGSARVTWEDGSSADVRPGAPPSGDAAAQVDEAIREFREGGGANA